jgi:hypothetical protein
MTNISLDDGIDGSIGGRYVSGGVWGAGRVAALRDAPKEARKYIASEPCLITYSGIKPRRRKTRISSCLKKPLDCSASQDDASEREGTFS